MNRNGATLMRVAHPDDALAVAADIFKWADAHSERVTLWLVQRHLAELAGHQPGCGCVCAAAAGVKPQSVYQIAANWQAQTAVTRRRARR